MKKFLVPAAMALAMTVSSGAFAASMGKGIDLSLYEETSPFTEIKAPAFTNAPNWQSADRNTQWASNAPMAVGESRARIVTDDLYGPE